MAKKLSYPALMLPRGHRGSLVRTSNISSSTMTPAVSAHSSPDLLLSIQNNQLTVHRLYALGSYSLDGLPSSSEITELALDLPTGIENLTGDDLSELAHHISVLTANIQCSSWVLVAPQKLADTLASLLLEKSLERLDRLVRLDPSTILMNHDLAELAVA